MSLELVKTPDGTGLAARGAPAGTKYVHLAYGATAGPATDYSSPDLAYVAGGKLAIPTKAAHTPAVKFVSAIARTSNGSGDILPWTGWVPVPTAAPPPPAAKVMLGLCLNMSPPRLLDWQNCAAAGAIIGRTDHGTLTQNATFAAETGRKLLWIYQPGSPPLAEYDALPAALKAVVWGMCCGNENWPPDGAGHHMTGGEYGAHFIHDAPLLKQRGLWVGCQERLAPSNTTWNLQLLTTPGLEEALAGGHVFIDSHPYYGRATAAQRSPSSLTDFTDVDGNGWGSQRYLKVIDQFHAATGLHLPVFMSEIGYASAPGVPDSVNSVGAVASNITELGKHLAAAAKGEVKTPAGLVAEVLGATYYDLYAWSPGGAESFGIMANNPSGQQVPRTEGGIYGAFTQAAHLVNT